MDNKSGLDKSQGEAAVSRVVILVKSLDSVKGAVAFLNRRGVAAQALCSLNSVIELCAKREVDILLISVNFPHPRIEMIPALFGQGFNLESIVFAESHDRKTDAKLAGIKAQNIIFGPVSGPTILLRIRQIEKELAGVTILNENPAAPGKAVGVGVGGTDVVVSGAGTAPAGDALLLRGRGRPADPELLARLMKTLSDPDPGLGSERLADGPASLNDELHSGSGSSTVNEIILQKGHRGDLKKSSAEDGRGVAAGFSEGGLEPDTEESDGRRDQQARRPAEDHEMDKRRGKGPVVHSPDAIEQTGTGRLHGGGDEFAAEPMEIEDRSPAEINSLKVWRSLDMALADLFGHRAFPIREISEIQSLALLDIRSAAVNGCFVVAGGQLSIEQEKLLSGIRDRLLQHLSDNQLEVALDHTEVHFIHPGELSKDHLKCAEFMSTLRGEYGEASCAFVSGVQDNPLIRPGEGGMSSVELKQIEAGLRLTFDAYIYMPANKKYLRYGKSGAFITEKQSRRLSEHQVDRLYFPNDQLQDFKSFYKKLLIRRELDRLMRKKIKLSA